MLWSHLDLICNGTVVLMLLAMASASYAYFINSRRPAGDEKKEQFIFIAIFLLPITFIPLLIGVVLLVLLFILRALLYGVFLIIYIAALVGLRKWFFLVWLHKAALYIGDRIMAANTFIIRVFFRPWVTEPGTA